jgi:hypothetical protein
MATNWTAPIYRRRASKASIAKSRSRNRKRGDGEMTARSDASLAAAYLGSLGKGKKKTLSQAERARRRALLARVRRLRWAHKEKESR